MPPPPRGSGRERERGGGHARDVRHALRTREPLLFSDRYPLPLRAINMPMSIFFLLLALFSSRSFLASALRHAAADFSTPFAPFAACCSRRVPRAADSDATPLISRVTCGRRSCGRRGNLTSHRRRCCYCAFSYSLLLKKKSGFWAL